MPISDDPKTGDVRVTPGVPRTKAVIWDDPARLAAAGAQLSGRELLQAIVERRLPPPPIANLVSAELVSIGGR